MSRIETKTGTVTLIPSGTTGSSNLSITNEARAYHNADYTSGYAQYTITKNTTGSVYLTFDAANIPSNATITSVSGRVRIRTYSSSVPGDRAARLYVGSTAMGSSKAYSASTASYGAVNTLTPGAASTWSPSDFDNLRLYMAGSSTGNNRYWRVYGADVTVGYSYDVYYYTVTASSTGPGTVSPTSQEYEAGETSIITLTPNVAGLRPSKVLDNNVDVTSQIVASGNNFTYTLTGLAADHTIIVTFRSTTSYNISGTVASSLSVSPSLPTTAYESDNFDLTITPTLPGTITVVDNNVTTATYEIDVGDYSAVTYTIENVQAAHILNITFVELAKYNITGTIASGLSISPSLPVNNKYKGTNQTFTITPTEPGVITVRDNNIITATYAIARGEVHSVEYSITDISANHTLAITFEALQQYQISGTIASSLSISPSLPQSIYTGEDITFTITPTAGGTITVEDNGIVTATYAIPRSDVHSVTYEIIGITEAHILNITYEAPQTYTVSGSAASGLSLSPSLPQILETGENLALSITPTAAGVIKVFDNDREEASYQIITGQIAAVTYHINNISESHVLNITFESLPQYTITSGGIASGLTVSPSLPITKYLGESQTFTITPNATGTITILENDVEKAVHYIASVHAVSYSLTNIAADHELEFKFSELPEFTAIASLTGTGTLSSSSITQYAGNDITFTITGVPTSNIIIATQDGKNISAKLSKSGTTYTYTFTLINDTNITFVSKVPTNVTVTQTIDQGGTINPSTTQTVLEGDEYTLIITPSDYQTTSTPPISVSDNYIEVRDALVAKHDTDSTTFTASSQTTSGVNSNSGQLTNAVGHTAESPYSISGNAYASQNNTGYCIYSFNFSSIPNDAVITGVSCRVYGHAENSTYTEGSRECSLQMYNNSTAVGTKDHFTSTSNYILEMTNCGTWTRSTLDNLKLRCTVAYYGGAVGGISLVIEYEIAAQRYYYTVPVYEAKTISVKYKPDFYVKVNNQWHGRTLTSLIPKINGDHVVVKSMYVKIGGVWKSVD